MLAQPRMQPLRPPLMVGPGWGWDWTQRAPTSFSPRPFSVLVSVESGHHTPYRGGQKRRQKRSASSGGQHTTPRRAFVSPPRA